MSEDAIKIEDIGIIQNTNSSSVDLPYNPLAHTVKAFHINEFTVRYQDGSEETIQARTLIKRIDTVPYYLDRKTSPVDHYMEMWALAQKAGLPVAPTAKINDHELSVIDISEGGVFFDKAMAGKLDPNFKQGPKITEEGLKHPSYAQFLKISLEEIQTEVRKLVDIANKHDLWLPEDDPMSLLVLPDGRWRLVILDPMNLRKYDREKKEFLTTTTLPFPEWNREYTPEELNQRQIGDFMQYIQTIRDNIPAI